MIHFLDDILVPSENIQDHLKTLAEVFRRLRDAGLEIRKEKCFFLQTEITYLGYKINQNEIRPTNEGVQGVVDFPVPTTTRKVHAFVGLAGYFRKFIRNFSIIAKPLYNLLKKDEPFKFGVKELEALEKLKNILSNGPVLAIYNHTYETELHTDASKWGFGAMLLQKQEDKLFHPVFFFSKRTDQHEEKLHSFELETLAVIHALKRFRVYLHGVNFKIVTDCEALINTLKKKEISPKTYRWSLYLQEFDYKIEHRKAEKMVHVDCLSRNFEINVIVENTLEERLTVGQGKDKDIKELRDRLEKSNVPLFEMRNGLVYRKHNKEMLFVVPTELESNVIRASHDDFGHQGIEKSYAHLSSIYWFKNAKEKVKEHIKNCLKCITYSPNRGKSEGILYNIPKKSEPFDTIHINFCGPFNLC